MTASARAGNRAAPTGGAYPRDSSIQDLFAAVVVAFPERTAVRSARETLTYRQVDALADQVAASLFRAGVEPGEPVALLGRRSVRAPAAIMGILRAGGAYVPVDPAVPPGRVAGLGMRYAIAVDREPSSGSWPFQVLAEVERLDLGWSAGCASVDRDACDLAYIMFTSGSTGTPKAVGVTHRGVVRLVRGTDYVTITEDDRVSHVIALTFDLSVFEVFGALLNGACLVVAGQGTLTSPTSAREFVRQADPTVTMVSTGVFHHLAAACPDVFDTVGTVLICGDVLDPGAVAAVRAHSPATRLLNAYGPTENTAISTVFEVTGPLEPGRSIPIGRSIANSTAYVVRPDGRLAAVGETGELWVGGDGVAVGYLNDPTATLERFVPDRFGRDPNGRLYRTGDRARWRADGMLEFLGRLDRQVKVRDHRIELDEVELAFTSHPAIAAAAVVVQGADTRTRVLAAYYEVHPAHAAQAPDRTELRRHLGDRLPHYMIPTRFVEMSKLPLNAHGKVDRGHLGEGSTPTGAARPGQRNQVSESVLTAWRAVFKRSVITMTDDFFELGGNSLMAAEVFTRLEQDLGIRQADHERLTNRLFSDATPKGMADEVIAILDAVEGSDVDGPVASEAPARGPAGGGAVPGAADGTAGA